MSKLIKTKKLIKPIENIKQTQIKSFTREQLRDHVHSIHNFIRNSGAGYGMTALKMFNIFYSLKLLDGKINQIGLSDDYNWSKIKEINNDTYFKIKINSLINKLRDICLGSDTTNNVLTTDISDIYDIFLDIPTNKDKQIENVRELITNLLYKCTPEPNINKDKVYFIYHQIPDIDIKGFYKKLFEKIDELDPINNFDIKGKVYEYFIGRDESAISDLGAYFTDRHITNFIMENLEIKIDDDKQIPRMIDPFGGSGGMTISYANHLNTKYRDKFDWDTNYKNIHHWDMAEDVVKIAGIEYFSICGNFPSITDFSKGNSFMREFNNLEKFNFCISNPPYGGDKNKKTSEINKKEFIIKFNNEYIEAYKNILIKELTLNKIQIKKFNKIFDQTYDPDELFEEYELDEDIHMDEIKKIIILGKQNIRLKKEIDSIITLTKEEQVNYSTCSKGIQEYIKLIVDSTDQLNRDRIIEFSKNDPLLKSYGEMLEGKQFKKRKTDDYDFRDKESCSLVLLMGLLATNGTCVGVLKEGVFFDSKYSTVRNYLVNNFNITEIISVPQDQFENTTTKTSIIIFKNNGPTTKINFYDLEVKKRKETLTKYDENEGHMIYEMKDEIYSVDKKFLCAATYDEISIIKYELNKNSEPNFTINYSLNSKDYKKEIIMCPNGYELKKLGDICKFKRGTRLTDNIFKSDIINNTYNIPIYGAGSIQGYTNEFNRDKYNCIICRVGSIKSKNCCKITNTNLYLTDAAFTIEIIDKSIQNYIFTYFYKYYDKIFTQNGSGSVQLTISAETLNNLRIPFPIDIKSIEPLLLEIKKSLLENNKINYNKLLDELFKNFPKTENNEIIDDEIIDDKIINDEIIDHIQGSTTSDETDDDIIVESKKKSTKKETNDDIIIEPKKKLTTKSKEIIDNIVVKEKKLTTKTKETNDEIIDKSKKKVIKSKK